MNTKEYLDIKEYVNLHVCDFLPDKKGPASVLIDAMKYSLCAGGKRMRSALCIATAEMLGISRDFVLPFACAIEYIQTYSLIHDDLPCMDNDDLRRGKPTNHKVFGDSIALLAGDGLLSLAYETMSKSLAEEINPLKTIEKSKAFKEIASGTGTCGMIAGQVADMLWDGKKCDAQTLDFIHNNKTMAFIKSSILAGAYLGGANAETIEKLSVYGESLGLAFQIIDDIGDAEEEPNKNTYPNMYGIDESKNRAKALISTARKAIEDLEYNTIVLQDVLRTLEDQITND